MAAANATGLSRLIGASAWRQNRLLILGYHGISDSDLHEWNPALFMHAEDFRRRLSLLREAKCNVLDLGEALERLENGTLPARSVVLTFDDGFVDFYRVAWPMLQEFGFPATLYLTTYYMRHGSPVFDPALDYLLWKGRGRQLDWPEIISGGVSLDSAGRRQLKDLVRLHALKRTLTAAQKDDLLVDLARRLGLDYEALRQSRRLSLINEDEARSLSMDGADLQLHTHRHRTSVHEELFSREIVDNRNSMRALGIRPEHFSYPHGLLREKGSQWLTQLGVKSAATCEAGLADRDSSHHLLPRVVDCAPFTQTELLAWAHGTAALLPHRGKAQEIVTTPQEQAELELLTYSAANR